MAINHNTEARVLFELSCFANRCWAKSNHRLVDARCATKVPDQPCAIPAHPLHAFELRTNHLGREGLSRAALGRRNHNECFRARIDVCEVRPSSWKVYGLLHDAGPRIPLTWNSPGNSANAGGALAKTS